jgi:hypothetical protein
MTMLIAGKQYLILHHDEFWDDDVWDVATCYSNGFQTGLIVIQHNKVIEYYLLDELLEKARSKTDG